MSTDDYIAHKTWQIHSYGATESNVQTADTGTIVRTEIATLYVLQDIRDLLGNFTQLWADEMMRRRNEGR